MLAKSNLFRCILIICKIHFHSIMPPDKQQMATMHHAQVSAATSMNQTVKLIPVYFQTDCPSRMHGRWKGKKKKGYT